PEDAVAVVRAVVDRPELSFDGLWTHFAVADEPANPFTDDQCARFDAVVERLAALDLAPRLVHACNSAGALTAPKAHHDMVRCGIALYGVAPSPALAAVQAVAGLRSA